LQESAEAYLVSLFEDLERRISELQKQESCEHDLREELQNALEVMKTDLKKLASIWNLNRVIIANSALRRA
jgi:plasmid maintenance system killer protein